MATFPTRESDIVVLAQSIIQGLTTQAETFNRTPYTAAEIRTQLDSFLALRDALIRQQALVSEAVTAKQGGLDKLADALRSVLRYIENAAASEDQLAHFGWSGRRTPGTQPLPGQCRLLEAPRRGPGWIFLDWKEPAEGGKPSYYVVEMRELPDGAWKQVATAVESEITLANQVSGKRLEYRAYAANKAGKGMVSNVVEVDA